MKRLTLVPLSALAAVALTFPASAAVYGTGEPELTVSRSVLEPCPGGGMGAREQSNLPHHRSAYHHPRHHASHPSQDAMTRQLNAQEYASHLQSGAAPYPSGNAFSQGYNPGMPPMSTPEVNKGVASPSPR
jgi:hypothetical protein